MKPVWLVLLIAMVVLVVLGSFTLSRLSFTGTSDEELAKLVRAVPVPAGVSFVPPESHQTYEDGLMTHHREVSRNYTNSANCNDLLSAWSELLQGQHRQFVQDTSAPGLLRLRLTDSPIKLFIVLGVPDSEAQCKHPGIDAVGSQFH